MLFPGGQRQHEPALPVGIHRLAAQPPRHLPHIFVARRKQPQIRPAKVQAVADGLTLANDDVGSHLPRRPDRAEGHDFGDHHDQQRALGVASCRKISQIGNMSE